MVILRARLTPEQGAVVQRALEAATERLYQESKDATPPDSLEEEVSFTQRGSDALALIAERALQSDLDGGASDRYQVVVHVETTAEPAAPVQTFGRNRQGAVRRASHHPLG